MGGVLNKTLRLFLDSIGRREEYEFYLRNFKSEDSPCFAGLLLEPEGLDQFLESLAFDLRFLMRLELFPAVILTGGGGAFADRLASGCRSLARYDLPGCPGQTDWDKAITGLNDFLASSRGRQRTPMVVCPSCDRLPALRALVPRVARRIHVIRLRGALRDKAGADRSFYTLIRENPADLTSVDRPLVALADSLLSEFPDLHFSVSSPWNLPSELFTVKGAGCVVRRGSVIVKRCDADKVDCQLLAALLEESFGRKLRGRRILVDIDEFYLEQEYRGAALLKMRPSGAYLSKFAVGTMARGEGLAADLWSALTAEHPALFWRSRRGNPINHWYERRAEGSHAEGDWRVFWRGITGRQLAEVVPWVLERRDDFFDAG